MPTKAEYEGRGLKKLKKEAAKRSLKVDGTGPNGRVLIADLAAALVKDDAKGKPPEVASQADPMPPTADIEAAEPAGGVTETESDDTASSYSETAHAKGKRTESAADTKTEDRRPQLGDVVSYRDEFSGQRSDARISAVHDSRTVSLAIFRKGGADPKQNVSFGHDRGSWSWKD